MFAFELERCPPPDIVADILFVDQNFVDRPARPGSTKIGENTSLVQTVCDIALALCRNGEITVDTANDRDLVIGSRHQDNPVRGDALVLKARKFTLGCTGLIDQHPPQTKSRRPALAKTKRDQMRLTGEHLDRELPAIFTRHDPFDGLDNRRTHGAIVVELLAAE